jgi:sulfate transport system ATP-binding protein
MTRTHARSLGVEPGVQVWLTPASGATVVPAMRALVG